MKNSLVRILDTLVRVGLFLLAFGLVVLFILEIDSFVQTQRLYFLRTGDWEDLVTVTVFGILIAYVLKRLLLLQFKWGFKR